jgi:hypothetical protein
MSRVVDAIPIDKLYVDRVWVKAYPVFFAYLRYGENWAKFRSYMEEGVFKDMTEHFFRIYRTINGLRIAFRRGVGVTSVEDLRQLLRYGEREESSFEPFVFYPDGSIGVGRLKLTRRQVESSRWVEYTRVDERKGVVVREKMFYMEWSPWLRIAVKPFLSGFTPPMIRFFLNGIIFAKEVVGFNASEYEFHTENWVDPYASGFDFESFMRVQGHFLGYVRKNIPKLARDLWVAFFGRDEDLEVKVTQVELAHDCYVEKLKLVNALRLVAGRHKTLKYDAAQRKEDVFATWGSDVGLKYYVTVRRGFQLKVYTKAVHKATGRALNRFEMTLALNRSLSKTEEEGFMPPKVWGEVVETVKRVNMGLVDEKTIEEIRAVLRQFVRCRKPEYRALHEAFLLDLFIHGQVKGKGVYRELARIYARRGLIEIKGKGRNSVYVLKPEFLHFHENLKRLFGEIPVRLLVSAQNPQNRRE